MRRLSLIVGMVVIVGIGATNSRTWGAQPDLSGLIRDLSSSKATTREQAAETLGNYGPAAADAVPALAAALKDGDPRVRHQALIALERIGPVAAPAVPDLQALVEKGPASMK